MARKGESQKNKPEDKKVKEKKDHSSRNHIIEANDKRRAETTARRMKAKHNKILGYVSRKAIEANIRFNGHGKSPRRDRKNLSKLLKKLRSIGKDSNQ